jgi:hypothetical protein
VRTLISITVFVCLLASGCGGGSRSEADLKNDIPNTLPTPEEVAALFPDSSYPVDLVESGFWTNEEAADEYPRDVEQTGRVTGYRAIYHSGPPDANPICCFDVGVTVSLYEDVSLASNALNTRSRWATGDPLDTPELGDESIAWPMRTLKEGASEKEWPDCPCDFRFRVGPYVGTVSVSHGGPPRVYDGLDPDEVALAGLWLRA